jgi:NAD(P)-dependent dehydrogenase (short-subunit alcohol dehydrogenase family)
LLLSSKQGTQTYASPSFHINDRHLSFISSTQAAAFPISKYDYKEVQTAFRAVRTHWPNSEIRVALFNAGLFLRKPFLEITEDEVDQAMDTNFKAGFAFAREAVAAFQGQPIDEESGKRGTLLFTGATASLRGNTLTAAFSTGKFALRSLSQSLNKEFAKDNIHVCAPFDFVLPAPPH